MLSYSTKSEHSIKKQQQQQLRLMQDNAGCVNHVQSGAASDPGQTRPPLAQAFGMEATPLRNTGNDFKFILLIFGIWVRNSNGVCMYGIT